MVDRRLQKLAIAVGDEDFQKRCMGTMADFQLRGKTILFVSHSPDAIRAICHRVCVLDHGRLLFDGSVEEGLATYHRLLAGELTGVPAAP